MIMRMVLIILICITVFMHFGCAEHKVDTFQEWCEQIQGVDLNEKYKPIWALSLGISFDGDAIRDEFTEFLNKVYLEKVGHRSPKMAWREGTSLHLVNISSLLEIEPEVVISKWREGIESSKQYKHNDPDDLCLYGSVTGLFDSLHIHTMEPDALGVKWTEKVTIIQTDREKRLDKDRL